MPPTLATADPPPAPCPDCGGLGLCDSCGGDGTAEDDGAGPRDCPVCDGTGLCRECGEGAAI